ncbi:MAG TPA: hypothetical protein VMW41_01840 [Candidatus Bathyarchaeia archaeon]|nr:hypothetical protein [Candidatus Bathyarchaeia archaeon]
MPELTELTETIVSTPKELHETWFRKHSSSLNLANLGTAMARAAVAQELLQGRSYIDRVANICLGLGISPSFVTRVAEAINTKRQGIALVFLVSAVLAFSISGVYHESLPETID